MLLADHSLTHLAHRTSDLPLSAPDSRRDESLTVRDVYRAWWPLAASWLLMGFELPAVSAFVARLADPEIHLAAYGGIVFPLALLIESPIIMLLAASTALCRDHAAYQLVRRYAVIIAGSLTGLHVALAFTPLFDLVALGLLGAPAEILEPARLGFMIMTPWTFSIAMRRFQQGVLIRFGHSREVGLGTAVRLAVNLMVLIVGLVIQRVPGIAVGTAAVALGVIAEALYIRHRTRPVLRDQLPAIDLSGPALTEARFRRFYAPLSVTPLLLFLAMPMASAAMGRMPMVLASLAAWPVVNGLIFTFRSVGFGLNEVVVAQLEKPNAVPALRSFTLRLALGMTILVLLFAITPLGEIWFRQVSALKPELADLAGVGLLLAAAIPGMTALQSLYQGAVVHGHRTRAVTEAMLIYIGSIVAVLAAGVAWQGQPGLYFAVGSMAVGNAAQLLWLRIRARPLLRAAGAP
jgi:hypothetical protein